MKPRYKDLKEEMRNYAYLPFGEMNKILIKAQQYENTAIAKSMKATGRKRKGAPLTVNHLQSIILYCDYSDLSRDFTISFRKTHPFQPLSQIKNHNSKYYYWSKILKETIKEYGQNNTRRGGNGLLSKLDGPFFCGMCVVLNITQFNMFIYSPLSTSVHLEIAMKFSGEEGMILEMNNKTGMSQYLKGMDVSWISRYREEDERYDDIYFYYLCLLLFVLYIVYFMVLILVGLAMEKYQ